MAGLRLAAIPEGQRTILGQRKVRGGHGVTGGRQISDPTRFLFPDCYVFNLRKRFGLCEFGEWHYRRAVCGLV
jgi:hypothetical protein